MSYRLVLVVPFFPFRYCLGGQMFLPDIFLPLSHICFIRDSGDSFDTYSAHDWRFFWLKSCQAFACNLLKADMVSPHNSRLCRTLLSRARLVFRASRHSSSNQGFDCLGMVVALGIQSFAALVMCSTKECKGSASSSISLEMLSKHTSWNYSQLALAKTQWEGSQLGCISATDGRSEVSMGYGHCHGYRVGPPTQFSDQVLVWRWSDLSLTLACSHAGLEVSDRWVPSLSIHRLCLSVNLSMISPRVSTSGLSHM